MSSRDEIIGRIKKLALEESPLPVIPDFSHPNDLPAQFQASLEANHARYIECKSAGEANEAIGELTKPFSSVVSVDQRFPVSTFDIQQINHPADLQNVEMAVIGGAFGVAENGAIWMPEQSFGIRALPFIVLHLVVVLNKKDVVANMHEAYKRIEAVPGFGTFIAGPSKTADIEQALVIGAHGPKSLTVVVV